MEQTNIASPRDHSIPNTNDERPNRLDEVKLWHRLLQHVSWLILLAIVVVIGLLYLFSDGFRTEVAELWAVLSSGDQANIREYISSYGAWAPVASVMLMVLQVIVAPVPASVVQLSNGVVFGIFGGTVLNLIGQLAGATAAFFISRALGRTAAEKFAGRIDERGVFEQWLDRWGTKALLLVRMVPGMPSDFVSYLMGLTSMPFRRYFTYSLIGYVPQSLAYAWLGDYASDWFWWIVLGGFVVSGAIGGVIWVLRKYRRAPVQPPLKVEPGRDSC